MPVPPAQTSSAIPVAPAPKRFFSSKIIVLLVILIIIGVAAGYIAMRPTTDEEENLPVEEGTSTETGTSSIIGTSTEEGTTTLPILGTGSEEGTTSSAGTSSEIGTSSVGTTKEQEEYLLELREDVEKEKSSGSEPIPENQKVPRPRD